MQYALFVFTLTNRRASGDSRVREVWGSLTTSPGPRTQPPAPTGDRPRGGKVSKHTVPNNDSY